MQTKTLKSDLLLLVAAFIWGTTFVAQRKGMAYVGPMTYNAIRFALGAATLLPVILFARAGRKTGAQTSSGRFLLYAGCLTGLALFGGASMQQMGLVYTSAGKASFITSLYVVLVPIVGLFLGQRCGWSVWAGAVLAVAGLYLLTVRESLHMGQGDLLVLIGAFFWTAHVHLIGYFAKRANPLCIACLQFLACAALSLLAAVLSEKITLPAIYGATIPILYGGILSAGVAFTLQVVCQRTSPPAHAAIVMSLETVFAVLAGYVMLGERFGPRDFLGCGLMFAGLLVVQLPPLLGSPTADSRNSDKAPTSRGS
jgi:drug/metabolite transporter (DMT)-like permease